MEGVRAPARIIRAEKKEPLLQLNFNSHARSRSRSRHHVGVCAIQCPASSSLAVGSRTIQTVLLSITTGCVFTVAVMHSGNAEEDTGCECVLGSSSRCGGREREGKEN